MLSESWRELGIVAAWSVLVVILFELAGWSALVMPVLPVTLIGIAVSLYLGFKSTSSYHRWWEARQHWGTVITSSRAWATQVESLLYDRTRQVSPEIRKELIYRQLGFVYALAYQLRRTSRLKPGSHKSIFARRRPVDAAEALLAVPEIFGRFLSPQEYAAARAVNNPAGWLILRQGKRLRELAQAGMLDDIQQSAMVDRLAVLLSAQGGCERIKNTPFPRQIAHFGTVFTWIFVLLLPLAFLDVFEHEAIQHDYTTIATHRFMYTLVPFTLLISWVFFMMEKISDSSEDPFEGGVHDVPVSAICRTIEIDLRQALGETDVPAPLAPVDDVLY
jgi:putative membrane protein